MVVAIGGGRLYFMGCLSHNNTWLPSFYFVGSVVCLCSFLYRSDVLLDDVGRSGLFSVGPLPG